MIPTLIAVFLTFLFPITVGWLVGGKPKLSYMLLVAIAAFGSFLLWRQYSPYPNPLNWDIWEHQTVINEIINANFALFPSQLSDTFGFTTYTTLFHVWLALPQALFHPDVMGFWWISEAYMTFLTALAAYGLALAITKNNKTALVAGIASSFLFESSVVFTPYFMLPQTVSALCWVFGITYIISQKQKSSPWIVATFALTSLATHAVVGAAGILLGALFVLMEQIERKNRILGTTILGVLPIATYILLWFLASHLPFASLNSGEAVHYTQPFAQKLETLNIWYGFLPLLLLPFGIMHLFKLPKGTGALAVLTVSAAACAVVLSPIAYSMKFYTLFRYLFLLVLSCGILQFLSLFRSRVLVVLLCLCMAGAQSLWLQTTIRDWQASLLFNGAASHISKEELNGASQLHELYATKNTMIVSDPATSYIMEGITGINSPGGAYMNPDNRRKIAALLTENDLQTAISRIQDKRAAEKPDTYLWIVSARYFQWIAMSEEKQMDFYYNIWRPYAFSLENRIALADLESARLMKPVFENDAMVVFELQGTSL